MFYLRIEKENLPIFISAERKYFNDQIKYKRNGENQLTENIMYLA